MRIIALSRLKAFYEHPGREDSKSALTQWYAAAKKSAWDSPTDVKRDFGSASILKSGRVVFNIAGNKYRLVVWINYAYKIVYIRFIGTHEEYDGIDVQEI